MQLLVEITRAMIDLLKEGLMIDENPTNYHDKFVVREGGDEGRNKSPASRFLFVSETCVPIVSLAEMDISLYGSQEGEEKKTSGMIGCSWINGRNTPNNGYARQLQWDKIQPCIPRCKIWKADQWMLLTRMHAKNVVEDVGKAFKQCKNHVKPLWQCFRNVNASDEIYFPTVLALLGVLGDSDKNKTLAKGVWKRRVTYCDWTESAKNPKSFTNLQEFKDVVNKAREEGCLLARKFSQHISIEDWSRFVIKTVES